MKMIVATIIEALLASAVVTIWAVPVFEPFNLFIIYGLGFPTVAFYLLFIVARLRKETNAVV
jgi:hypothetical protein